MSAVATPRSCPTRSPTSSSKLNVGGITKPRVVENGVSMMAICSKEASQDTTYLAANLRQTAGNGALKAEADKYLADLKAKAQIVYS